MIQAYCTVTVEIENKLRTSFKSLASKKERPWQLKRTSGQQ